MKLKEILKKLFEGGSDDTYIGKDVSRIDVLIDTEILLKNLNDLTIDIHNLVEEKRVYEPKKDFKKINLNEKEKRKIYKYLNI